MAFSLELALLLLLLVPVPQAVAFHLLPGVRCTGDFGQTDGVASVEACEAVCSSVAGCDVFSYCPTAGAGSCPVSGGCWYYHYAQLPACQSNQSGGWVSGWQAPPSPTPAPTPPADWAPIIARGDMAWSVDDPGVGMFPLAGNGF
jgi:hypothetical protein